VFVNNEQTNGWTVSGQFDYLTKDGDLIDFKTTSAWAVVDALKNGKSEWEAQLNILDWLIRHSETKLPIKVKSLSIVAILRDWSKMKALTSVDYPKQQVVTIPITMWSDAEQDAYVQGRIALHQSAALQEEPPICSPEERWNKPDTYAVMKDGRKSAVRLLPSMDEAKQFIKDNGMSEGKGCKIVLRAGEDTRCAHYCAVRDYCTHWTKVSF